MRKKAIPRNAIINYKQDMVKISNLPFNPQLNHLKNIYKYQEKSQIKTNNYIYKK